MDSRITSGENKSYWISTTKPLFFEKIRENTETDVLIVGGGISGLTTAYYLLKLGYNIVLVEDGYLGSGETGRTTAHITYALDDRYYEIEKMFGREKTRLVAESHAAALEWISNVVRNENIDCNFKMVHGYLYLNENDKDESLDKEYEATKNAGLLTEILNYIPGLESPENKRCLKFPDQGQFHIMKYMSNLANAVVRMGGKIYTETKAGDINKEGAKANGYDIKAKHIVVATNTPVNDLVTMHTKQWPYRTYVIAATVPKGKLPYALWWDTGDMESKWVTKPYNYVRLEPYDDIHDLLISGGYDHKTGQADAEDIPETERFARLTELTRKRFPIIGDVLYQWSGQVMEPVDSLAYIGRNPGDKNIYIITGDSGNGMTHATIGAILISDLIQGKDNPWEEIYDPSRKPIRATGDYLKEAGNMAAQYVDWIAAGDIKNAIELIPGEGGVISHGLKKIAVYRDEENKLYASTAVCPHLGGILHWNATEKTFDCPVHGSRFTPNGKVVNGPAIIDLKKLDINED